MLIFHALAKMGREALILVSPAQRIVSIGYFQDADKVVDLEYCQKSGISVMRREIGGRDYTSRQEPGFLSTHSQAG